MYTHTAKSQENKSRNVASQPSSKVDGGHATFQLEDNRPEAVQLKKLQMMADNTLKAAKAARLQAMANSGPYSVAQRMRIKGSSGGPVQMQDAPEEDELQMKAGQAIIQRQGPGKKTCSKGNSSRSDQRKTRLECRTN